MPTYEYKCDACGYAFERFQSITADPVKRCPECGKAKVRRLIGTGAGMIFKGSGFYITDYRDQSYTDKAKADSGTSSEKPAEAKSETKSETKSESKSETTPAAAEPKSASKSASKSSTKSSKKK